MTSLHGSFLKNDTLFFAVSTVVTVLVVYFFAGGRLLEDIHVFYENSVFAIAPSAAHAIAYGDRHFNARDVNAYDIRRAEYFYDKALFIDPKYPLLQYQLARIAFLRGQYAVALDRINLEIAGNPKVPENVYYVRGLIQGYMTRYRDAAKDYERYLISDPRNWAALNDYAWVLIKAKRFNEAAGAAALGLTYTPENPWLLNSYGIASFELGHYEEALSALEKAKRAVASVTEKEWLTAYPGNDPKVAAQGLATLRQSIDDNMHTILMRAASSTVQ